MKETELKATNEVGIPQINVEESTQEIEKQAQEALANFGRPNRRQRRMALKFQGLIRLKNAASFGERAQVRRENIKNGVETHLENIRAIEERLANAAEIREASQVKTWKELGYNKKEIEMLKEANAISLYTSTETYREDKKRVRELLKNARSSRQSRN